MAAVRHVELLTQHFCHKALAKLLETAFFIPLSNLVQIVLIVAEILSS